MGAIFELVFSLGAKLLGRRRGEPGDSVACVGACLPWFPASSVPPSANIVGRRDAFVGDLLRSALKSFHAMIRALESGVKLDRLIRRSYCSPPIGWPVPVNVDAG